MSLVSVVIPVYNEEAAIRDDLETIMRVMGESGIDHEVLVVDDGSTDRTAEIVRQFTCVRLVQHPYNQGTGAATKTGIRHARGDIVIMTDGDGTYPNEDMPHLLSYMKDFDMVVGARVREAGTVPWLRTPAKTFIRLLASYMAGVKIPDLNSGLRCFRKEAAERFFGILPAGHSWVSTITLAYLSNGYTVKYVPIEYYPRRGKSSFHPFSDTYNYLSLVVRTIMYFDPLKVFLPVSLLLLLAGGAKLVRDLLFFVDLHIPTSTVVIILSGFQIGALGLLADLIVKRSK